MRGLGLAAILAGWEEWVGVNPTWLYSNRAVSRVTLRVSTTSNRD